MSKMVEEQSQRSLKTTALSAMPCDLHVTLVSQQLYLLGHNSLLPFRLVHNYHDPSRSQLETLTQGCTYNKTNYKFLANVHLEKILSCFRTEVESKTIQLHEQKKTIFTNIFLNTNTTTLCEGPNSSQRKQCKNRQK